MDGLHQNTAQLQPTMEMQTNIYWITQYQILHQKILNRILQKIAHSHDKQSGLPDGVSRCPNGCEWRNQGPQRSSSRSVNINTTPVHDKMWTRVRKCCYWVKKTKFAQTNWICKCKQNHQIQTLWNFKMFPNNGISNCCPMLEMESNCCPMLEMESNPSD